MAKKRDDGGPAFPSSNEVVVGDMITNGHRGLSVREMFAAAALMGLTTNTMAAAYDEEAAARTAKSAYALADAMIAAGKK